MEVIWEKLEERHWGKKARRQDWEVEKKLGARGKEKPQSKEVKSTEQGRAYPGGEGRLEPAGDETQETVEWREAGRGGWEVS